MDTTFQRASLALRLHGYDENTSPDEIVKVVLAAIDVPSEEMILAGVNHAGPWPDNIQAIWKTMVDKLIG